MQLIGDSLLASSFLSYTGAFTFDFRSDMSYVLWLNDLKEREVPLSQVRPREISKATPSEPPLFLGFGFSGGGCHSLAGRVGSNLECGFRTSGSVCPARTGLFRCALAIHPRTLNLREYDYILMLQDYTIDGTECSSECVWRNMTTTPSSARFGRGVSKDAHTTKADHPPRSHPWLEGI